MAEVKIHQLLNIQRRFLRSAQLERDFRDPTALQGYVVTKQTRLSFDRIAEGLNNKSGQRAWRITGDYGSGKSSFALLLAHLFSGKDSDLPSQIRKCLDLTKIRQSGARFLPVLVTGSREPLAVAVARSLADALRGQFDGRSKSKVLESLAEALAKGVATISDQSALQFLLDANSELIVKGKAQGLLIILDELGKFLEFAAFHPDRQDIFLLQQLAELSTRSGREPIFTIGLLHQGFNAYADQLSQSSQKEWEKVAGRFEEILFDQPLDQITQLICSALDVRKLHASGIETKAKQAMRAAAALGCYGAAPAASSLLEVAAGLYPLHPTLIPVLVKLFSRFGQNERSLFSFLLSSEPFGLQAFAQGVAGVDNFYQIHHLYDYASANFGHRLSVQSYRSHWNHIDSLVRSFPSQNETELAILKTVGLLNLINSPELAPSDELIVLALGAYGDDAERQVRSAIQRLHKERHVLYSRGRAGGYCLWSHSSVNLEAAYEAASRAIGQPQRVAAQVMELLDARPIVARRHYIQTGNLRHFDVTYCGLTDLERITAQPTEIADGRIIIPLCETPEEVQLATMFALAFAERPDTLIGITDPLASLSGLLLEVQRWTWVEKNTPELKDDRYAAEEVARQLSSAKQTLEKRIQHYAGLKQSVVTGGMSIKWYYQRQIQRIRSGTAFLSYLSDRCDGLYDKAPKIHNELVNRRTLSSAAASARMRLIERMFSAGEKEFLGMDPAKKPPEMSIYLSMLLGARLHVAKGGKWMLQEPTEKDDPCNLLPGLAQLTQFLENRPDTRVPVTEVFDSLRQPPYGIRNGVIPILLVLVLLRHEHEIALYENGTFLSTIAAEEILRLTKAPQSFELQFCRVQGVRRVLFDKLISALNVSLRSNSKAEVLDVVRPLCVFVAQLPEFTRKTARLSLNARAARDTILAAREPGTLLFKQLPEALSLAPFGLQQNNALTQERTQEFIAFLKEALDELKMTYPLLTGRIRDRLLAAFDAGKSGITFQSFRDSLSQRCQDLVVNVRDIDLKAFCLRMLDSRLPEADWLESVGSYVATTPPSRWKDEDEVVFGEKLDALVQKFRRVESIHFAGHKRTSAATAFRVALTARDGSEQERVVQLSSQEDQKAKKLEQSISQLLTEDERVSITAMSRVIWKLLEKSREQPTI